MKSKTISVVILSLVLSIPLILVSYAYFGSSTQSISDLKTLRLSKGKPNPKPEGEWINFTGHLVGAQIVEGCCPNAGPRPEYTMSLSGDVFPEEMSGEPHTGEIFMNVFMNLSLKGHGNKRSYLVKFWWSDYFIKIIGGDIEENKGRKTSTFTVIFVNEPCKIWINDILKDTVRVSFNLTRKQL